MRRFAFFLGWLVALTLFPATDSYSQTPRCSAGWTYNDTQKACVFSLAGYCAREGTTLQGDRCVTQVTCPAGTVNQGGGCAIPCPTGYTIKNYNGVSVCAGPLPCPSTARVVSYEENRRINGREPNAIEASGECRMECPGWWPVGWLERGACQGPGECRQFYSYDKTSGRCVSNMQTACSGTQRRVGDVCLETPSCGQGFQFKNGRCVRG